MLSFLYPRHEKENWRGKLSMESEKEQHEERRKTPERAQGNKRPWDGNAWLCAQGTVQHLEKTSENSIRFSYILSAFQSLNGNQSSNENFEIKCPL